MTIKTFTKEEAYKEATARAWGRTRPSPVTLPNGDYALGFYVAKQDTVAYIYSLMLLHTNGEYYRFGDKKE